MDNLAELAASVTTFASQSSLTLVPAVPETGLVPEVRLDPATLDLSAFLALARKLGGGVLYLGATPFDPSADETELRDPPTHLIHHAGQVGLVSVAFAVNGLVHLWQQRTAWHMEWQRLLQEEDQDVPTARGLPFEDEGDQLSAEERERAQAELIGRLLADSEFRAARASARQCVARLSIPPNLPEWVCWEAIQTACARADEQARARYDLFRQRIDELAVELVADSEYQRTSSAAARKQVVDQFLISRADGFSGPAYVRDELYARARQQR